MNSGPWRSSSAPQRTQARGPARLGGKTTHPKTPVRGRPAAAQSGVPQPALLSQPFASGSLIIPMDTDTTGNHASFNQNSGMWKAYGLVYKLLQSGVPVYWGISG